MSGVQQAASYLVTLPPPPPPVRAPRMPAKESSFAIPRQEENQKMTLIAASVAAWHLGLLSPIGKSGSA